MGSGPIWRRRRGPGTPEGQDPELLEIFHSSGADGGRALLQTAEEVRRRARQAPRPAPDPGYRAHLRASLMEEAHQRQRSRPRSRPQFGFVFGAGLGLAGLAMVALVLLSVIVPGRAQAVTVRASV
ncbi:MAG: hypothetical protein ACYCUD_13470, partial [Candidatus Dormibacteria bacterium]